MIRRDERSRILDQREEPEPLLNHTGFCLNILKMDTQYEGAPKLKGETSLVKGLCRFGPQGFSTCARPD